MRTFTGASLGPVVLGEPGSVSATGTLLLECLRKRHMSTRQFNSFADFWPYYLGEHSKPATRLLHGLGTLIALGLVGVLIAIGKWWLFPVALIPGYAFAWAAHFFIEKNRPATFKHPLWSFMGDWKMLALMLAGKLE